MTELCLKVEGDWEPDPPVYVNWENGTVVGAAGDDCWVCRVGIGPFFVESYGMTKQDARSVAVRLITTAVNDEWAALRMIKELELDERR